MTDRYQVEASERNYRRNAFWLKVVAWVLIVVIVGVFASIILGALKMAVDTTLIVGGVCAIIALLAALVYSRLKMKMKQASYQRQLRKNDPNYGPQQ